MAAGGIGAVPIGAPLPHVAAHVVYPQFVRFQLARRVGFSVRVATIPGHFVQRVAAAVQIAFRAVSAPGGEFPLGYGFFLW